MEPDLSEEEALSADEADTPKAKAKATADVLMDTGTAAIEEEPMAEDDDECGDETGLSRPKKAVRKFKVVVGRCPILKAPSAAELMGHCQDFLQAKEEFNADAVILMKSEQRTYLRLTRGKGWVCERSRNDIRKLTVVPVSTRKTPITAKMAKAIVFKGGDAEGHTTLRKEDLVKSRSGKIVSKKQSEAAKKRYAEGIGKWSAAVKRARDELGVSGFVKVKKGSVLYDKAREYYASGTPQADKHVLEQGFNDMLKAHGMKAPLPSSAKEPDSD